MHGTAKDRMLFRSISFFGTPAPFKVSVHRYSITCMLAVPRGISILEVWITDGLNNMISLINADSIRTLDDLQVQKTQRGALLQGNIKHGSKFVLDVQEMCPVVNENETIIRG
jgi:hypothetical protein